MTTKNNVVAVLVAAFAFFVSAQGYDPIVAPTNRPSGNVVAPQDVAGEFSDLLARTVATNAAPASAELLRAFVADLYATVSALPDSAALDEAVDTALATPLSNYVTRAEASAFATSASLVAALAALDAAAVGAIPSAGYNTITNASDIGIDPWWTCSFSSQVRAVRVTGEGTNYVSGVYAPNGVECHVLISGFDAVIWPTNQATVFGDYEPGKENAFAVRGVNGRAVVEKIFAK